MNGFYNICFVKVKALLRISESQLHHISDELRAYLQVRRNKKPRHTVKDFQILRVTTGLCCGQTQPFHQKGMSDGGRMTLPGPGRADQ